MSDSDKGLSITAPGELVAIGDLHHDPANVRTHNAKNLEAVKASLSRFGQQKPIVVGAGNVVIAGNGTLTAAKMLGWSHVAVVRSNLIGAEATAYAIADNRTAELAEWDDEALSQQLAAIQIQDEELALATGFSAREIERLALATAGPVEDEGAGEPPVDPITKPGDLWLLGNHRVLCGDSTKREDVERLMGGGAPSMMVTDPPYGVNLDQSWRDNALGNKAMGPGNRNVVANDDNADWSEAWSLFAGDVAYVWHAGKFSDVVMASLRNTGFEICQQLIWNKSVMVMGRSDYHFKHEPCWYAVRKGRSHKWVGDRTQTTVIDAKSPNHIMSGSDEEKTDHPTQKPVECMAYLMRNHEGDVYDPFLGSGTTLIAAEQTNRTCYGIEISPAYCDVIVARWEKFTGKKAVLSDG